MGAYANMDTAFAGLKFGLESETESWQVADASGVKFGYPVFCYAGSATHVDGVYKGLYSYKNDRGILTFSTDLSASNSTVITVNGTAVTAVVFATDHATTMAAIVAQIEADIAGANATLSSARVIHVDIDGVEMTVSGVVTGGSAVTIAATYTSRQVFVGVVQHSHKEHAGQTDLAGTSIVAAKDYVDQYDVANVMTRGEIYGVCDGAVSSFSAAYVTNSGANIGKFGDSSGGTSLTGAKYKSTKTAAGNVLVGLNV